MQKVPLRKHKGPISQMPQNDEEILHFTLQGLLPAGHVLVLNAAIGTLSYLICEQNLPHMVMEQQFTASETSILVPLLESYPYYCPYEVLLASFNHGHVTETNVERCRQRLQEAQAEGVWDQEMKPVRNILSRTRLKLRAFRIEISSIFETGYILMYMVDHKDMDISSVLTRINQANGTKA